MMKLKVVKNDAMCLFKEQVEFENVQQVTFSTASELLKRGHDVRNHKGKDMFFTLSIVLPNGDETTATFSCSEYFIVSY